MSVQETMGTQLITAKDICDELLNKIVAQLIMYPIHVATRYTRVGMNDIDEEGVYVWEDDSPVTHLRWAPNEPNNMNNEDCMAIGKGDGGYNDYGCEKEDTYFICEADYNKL